MHVFLTCTRQLKLEHCNRKWNYFLIVQWSKNTKYQTFRNVLSCKAPTFPFWGIFHYITQFLIVVWWLQKCPLSILERCPVKRELLSFCKPSSNHLATQPPVYNMFAVPLLFTTDTIALLNVLLPLSAHACDCFYKRKLFFGICFLFIFVFILFWKAVGGR